MLGEEPTIDPIDQSLENLSPIEKLKRKIEEAGKEAARKKEEETKQEESSEKDIKEYRELINQRTQTKQELEETSLEIGETKDIGDLEKEITKIEPKLKALEAIEFEGKLEETRNNLAELKKFIDETYLEADAKKLLIETLGGGENGQTEYNKLYKEAQQTQEEVSAKLKNLEGEYQKWSEEIKEIIEPIKNELQITEKEYPASPNEIDRFLKLLGEKINSHKELAAETQRLSDQLEKIDDKIFEILDNPKNIEKIVDIAQQEIKLSEEFTKAIEYKTNADPSLRKTELDKTLFSDLGEEFFRIQVEQYGLNNPEMTIGERQEKIKVLIENIISGFRDAENLTSITQSLEPKYAERYDQEDIQQRRDGAFLFAIMRNPESAHHIYNFEFTRIKNPNKSVSSEDITDYLKKRLKPYLPLVNILKAARDAQESLNLSRVKLFSPFETYSKPEIIDVRQQYNFYNVNPFSTSKALTEKPEEELNGVFKKSTNQKELTLVYEQTFTKYQKLLNEFKNKKILETNASVETSRLELENAKEELKKSNQLQEKEAAKLQLVEAINFPPLLWDYSERLQDLIERKNKVTKKINGTFGLFNKLRGDEKVLASLNTEIKNILCNLIDYKNSSKLIPIVLNSEFLNLENIENKQRQIEGQIYKIKLSLINTQRELKDSIRKTQEKISTKENEVRQLKSSPWYQEEEK